jgi:hypothetical protein
MAQIGPWIGGEEDGALVRRAVELRGELANPLDDFGISGVQTFGNQVVATFLEHGNQIALRLAARVPRRWRGCGAPL